MASPAPSSASLITSDSEKNHLGSLSILASLFFMWGFITVLNDILIPHLKSIFTLNYTQVMFVQFSFFTAYAVASIPSGALVTRIGYKAGIVIGLSVTGIGCLLFYPAAGMQSYGMFLGALFILACGITLLQVAANPYVTILGPRRTASSRLILTQAFNSLGTTVAPLLGAALILSVALKSADELAGLGAADLVAYRVAQARAVQTPYLAIAGVLFLLAVLFAIIRLPKIIPMAQTDEGGGSSQDRHASAWGYRHLVLGAVAVLLYVGAEVAVGSFLVSYFGEPEIGGLSVSAAGKLVAFYWGGLMVGRFAGAYFTRVIAPNVCLIINSVAAIALLLITMFTTGPVAMWSILAIGLANSIMFPAIFTLAVDGLGKHTSEGSGILCAAIVGGALVPVAQGMLADRIGIHHAFAVSLFCYAFVAYYGLSGYRPKIASQAS